MCDWKRCSSLYLSYLGRSVRPCLSVNLYFPALWFPSDSVNDVLLISLFRPLSCTVLYCRILSRLPRRSSSAPSKLVQSRSKGRPQMPLGTRCFRPGSSFDYRFSLFDVAGGTELRWSTDRSEKLTSVKYTLYRMEWNRTELLSE